MGDSSPPPTPDYAAANTAGVVADVNTLQARDTINQAAQLGTKGTVNIPGYGDQDYDFTGLGTDALTQAEATSEGKAADTRANYTLGLEQKYGPEFVAQETALTKQADPTRAALSDDYMQQVQSNYDLGAQLDPSTEREVEQGARGAEAARGNILGDSAAYGETMALGQAGEQREAQRQAVVQSALGLAPISAQFGSINQATGPVPINTQLEQEGGVNENAGEDAANFVLGSFATQSSNYQNAPTNPWMTLAGTAIGAAAGTAAHM